jgi:phospholipid/cholesterol/gamma-HCH transport system substrate-binding protein
MNRSTLIGLVTLGTFVAAVIFGLNATRGNPVKERATVEAEFDNVAGLMIGDDVRIASARVGYVEAMKVDDGHALLVLKIDDPKQKIYADATAVVTDRSGFGQKFVGLDPGTPQAGTFDGRIELDQTVRSEDINELFNVFDDKTRSAANSTLSQLGGGMTGHSQDLNDLLNTAPGILDNTATVSDALTVNQGRDFVGLLQSSDRLAARFAGRQQHVADVLDQMATTLGAIAVDDGGPEAEAIQDAPETLDDVKSALDDLQEPLEHTASAMDDLRPGAEALADATPDLRDFMKDAVEPLEDLPDVNELGEPALKSLTALVHDARPLARQLITTGDSGAPPATTLADYTPEVVRWFVDLGDTLKYETSDGLYTRILAIVSDESVGGTGRSLTVKRNVYGDPGTVDEGGN